MSSVCVGCCLCSTGGNAAFFLDLSLVVLTRIGLSYLTSELCGGIMAQATVGSECEFQQRAVRVSFRRATNTGPAFIHGLDKAQKAVVLH
jgi:hypothetical protein